MLSRKSTKYLGAIATPKETAFELKVCYLLLLVSGSPRNQVNSLTLHQFSLLVSIINHQIILTGLDLLFFKFSKLFSCCNLYFVFFFLGGANPIRFTVFVFCDFLSYPVNPVAAQNSFRSGQLWHVGLYLYSHWLRFWYKESKIKKSVAISVPVRDKGLLNKGPLLYKIFFFTKKHVQISGS